MESEFQELIPDRVHKSLCRQIHTGNTMLILEPQVMILIKIEMIVATIEIQRIDILFLRINISKVLSVEEIDLSHR